MDFIYDVRRRNTNLIDKGIDEQLKALDDYMEDRIYNVHRKRALGESLEQAIKAWDEKQKLDVIEKYITTRPSQLAAIIDWFDIKDNSVLLDVVNKIIENNGHICGNIEKFCIQDEATRIKIAKRDLMYTPNILMKNIDKFNITNQDAIIEIANMCFLGNEYSFCENFDKNLQTILILILRTKF